MDVRKIAAERKAKALADLKQAEEMERVADEIARLASSVGWHIDIIAQVPDTNSGLVVEAKNPSAATTTYPIITGVVLPPKRNGKPPDPNSPTSRSKSESIKIIRLMNRPVPTGELMTKLGFVGIKLGGKNPNQALSANLGHCPDLVSTRRGWWLKGVPLPPENSPAIGRGEGLPGLN
jgi:hypothetical protein